MKLQILVPQYKETDDVIRPLLDSIALQQNIDFCELGVIICNDGSDTYLSDDFLKSYPYLIEYYKEPHRGVSGARNACLDHAVADYVMFCDADDMFYNVCGIYLIAMYMEQGFDTLNSVFLEETRERPTGRPLYVKHENDATFVHGKVHRREYLLGNNIRWNEKLTIHEDSYFNAMCLNFTQNVKYCDTPFYLWKWRDDSVCRTDPMYLLDTYDKLLDSNDAMIDEFIKRGQMEKVMYFVCYMIFETYYTMNKPTWTSQDGYRKKAEKRFGEYYLKWKKIWDETPMPDKVTVSNQLREKTLKEGMLLEAVTIFDWLDRIGEEYGKQKSEGTQTA